MCDWNLPILMPYVINFKVYFKFEDCNCFENHQVFAIFCKKCHYNSTGFSGNYFALTNCCCTYINRNNFCKYCKTLKSSGGRSRAWTKGTGRPSWNFISKAFMRTKFLSWILLYLCYNNPLLAYFCFISFFNYYCKMVILVVI